MSNLKPSVLGMLSLGQDCGLNTLDEAYNNYMSHYDCFFLITDFTAQHEQFIKDLDKYNLLNNDNGKISLRDIPIYDAIILVHDYEATNE